MFDLAPWEVDRMLEVISVVLLLGILSYIYFLKTHIKFRKRRSLLKQIPGPKGLPLFGSAFDFLADPGEFDNFNKYFFKSK